MTPESRIAKLKAELAETREAAATMLANFAIASHPQRDGREVIARMYDEMAAGRMRSRITGIIARKVAEKLRGGE